MKPRILRKIILLIVPVLLSSVYLFAQLADWSFNNILTGTGSANTTAGNASLGGSIATGAFNGGTVYYGEGNWPAGAIDLNAYLEFSVTPTVAHTMTLASLLMQVRRSTTGVPSGSGPNNWALRSSLDGYASDISSGVLTTSSSPGITVVLGVAFMNLPAKVTFRLYGYNATVSTGGLNRFVYDDITINGSTVLPVALDYFNMKSGNLFVTLSWKPGGEGNLYSMNIERSANGNSFEIIKQYRGDELNLENGFQYVDAINHSSGNYAYRIQLISEDGHISYSAIQQVSFSAVAAFQLQPVNAGNPGAASFRVSTEKEGLYIFSLYNLNGNRVALKSVNLNAGSQLMQMETMPLRSGIYILLGENGNQKISTKIMVL